MSVLRIMLIGYGRSGKGTFCNQAAITKGWASIASSRMASELFLYDQLKDKYGYADIEACYADRHNHRQEWYEAIRDYNTPDKSRLGKKIFGAGYTIYDGCRDREEFETLKAAGVFDIAVWVDAGGRVEPESEKSMQLTMDDADIVICNKTSECDYLLKVQRLLAALGG